MQCDLWKHVKVHRHKPSDDNLRRRHQARGALLLRADNSVSSGLKDHIFSRMNNDSEGILINMAMQLTGISTLVKNCVSWLASLPVGHSRAIYVELVQLSVELVYFHCCT